MCGIAGIWGRGQIQPMVDILAHRGPDQEGIFRKDRVQLGVRRLAVIDLETGSQPMYNEDKSSVIVFNGEIFNYRDLRAELVALGHQFRSRSDTEVILHAYEQWSECCLSRFIGQFAFCIYDGKKLFLARDRMGEKPLYYYHKNGRFLFASEIKAILTQIETEPYIDEMFWVFDAPVLGKTAFADVHEVLPSTFMTYDGDRLEQESYWKISTEPVLDLPEEKIASLLRELIEDAVMIRMHADVPVGLFLSGGIDSAAMAYFARPSVVFSCRFDLGTKFDEFLYAQTVARDIGAEQIVVSPTPEDMQRRLSGILWHLDQPIATASSLAEFMLAESARKYVKVVLGGQGADELFGGYVRYLMMYTEHRLSQQPELVNYYSLAQFFWNPDMFREPAKRYYQLIRRASAVQEDPYISIIRGFFDGQRSLIDAMGFTDIRLLLPSLVTMNDRASAAYGLENRSPFLDHRIVEFAFRLPPELKIREFQTKYILRKALRGVVPDMILDRKDKKGLVVPIQQWFTGPLLTWAQQLDFSLTQRILLPTPLNGRTEFDRSLYTRVCLQLWLEKFFHSSY